jgi:hypothetical protein
MRHQASLTASWPFAFAFTSPRWMSLRDDKLVGGVPTH